MTQLARVDAAAISLSSLCFIHCLALPLLASSLPLMGVVAEAEWVHKVLVLFAIPVSAYALLQTQRGWGRVLFTMLAVFGVSLLVAGAFVEAFHDLETQLTVVGALTLMAAHIFRWQRHRLS